MAEDRALRGVDLFLRVLGRAGAVDGSDVAQTRSANDDESTPVAPEKLSDFTLAELQGRDQPSAGHRYHHGVQEQPDCGDARGVAHGFGRCPGRIRLRAHALSQAEISCSRLVIASLIVPYEILLVPNYIRVWKLGWLNHYQVMIVPPLAGAFGVFLMRQFMIGIPRELEDAAKLDGAGHARILWDIIIPATRGAIAALAIFTFIFYWNDFTWPYITISKANMMTMPIALIQFRQDFAITYGKQMAGNVLSALPAIIVFLARAADDHSLDHLDRNQGVSPGGRRQPHSGRSRRDEDVRRFAV